LFAVLALLPVVSTSYYVELGTYALIAAMLALSLQLLVGGIGLVSLGHGAFYGIAAYAIYLATPETRGLPVWITLPIAVAASGLLALVIGSLALRTRGFFFLMVTLAFGQMVYFVFHDTKLGGGTDGAFLSRPLLSFFGLELPKTPAARPIVTFYISLGMLAAMYIFLAALVRSAFGSVLAGIRVNEQRMLALGYDTYRYKLAAFVIAGVLAGIAGHMWGLHRGFVNPELVSWHRSAEALLMILIGGIGSLAGAVVGALAFTALDEIGQLLTERKQLVVGLAILAVVLLLPRGIAGLLTRNDSEAGPDAPKSNLATGEARP
jgi:branched-chain amino acid transport system permease protein